MKSNLPWHSVPYTRAILVHTKDFKMKTSHRPAIFASQYINRIVSSEHSMCQIRLLYTKYATVSKDISIHPYIISKSKLLSSGYNIPYPNALQSIVSPCRNYSEKDSCPSNYKETASNENQSQKTKTDQFKKAIKDYGSTVIIFHVAITLASFGFFYLLVSRWDR